MLQRLQIGQKVIHTDPHQIRQKREADSLKQWSQKQDCRNYPQRYLCDELENDNSSHIASANQLTDAVANNSDEGDGGITTLAEKVDDYIGENVIGRLSLF